VEDLEKLITVFADVLGIDPASITDSLSYGSKIWDSVAHMALVAAIDSAFDIMMDTEDVVDMSSFAKAKEILNKYGVDFEANR
jgi:acyl carrier protein